MDIVMHHVKLQATEKEMELRQVRPFLYTIALGHEDVWGAGVDPADENQDRK